MKLLERLSPLLHRHLLPLIVLSYGLAAFYPTLGIGLKETRLAGISFGPWHSKVTPQMLLLSFLLFNAGLAVRGDRLHRMLREPRMMLAGLAANLAVPLVYLMIVIIPTLAVWHNREEAGTILVGLALVSAMPIAGSSTGWSRSAGGDMALSLGLVLASTLMSPFTTPITLQIVGSMSSLNHVEELRVLAGHDAGTFLTLWVLLPSMTGMLARWLLGTLRTEGIEIRLKPIGTLVLLLLCYSGAASCLPRVLYSPDWDFLGLTLGFAGGLCLITFLCGQLIGRILGADRDQRTALMFALGMSNNGTGLVLASVAFATRPAAILPLIVYNLVQHVAAGIANAMVRRADERLSDRPSRSWSAAGWKVDTVSSRAS